MTQPSLRVAQAAHDTTLPCDTATDTDTNETSHTPLLVAIVSGSLEAVTRRLAEGADANTCGDDQLTPLRAALNMGHVEIALALRASGASLADVGRAPLHLVAGIHTGMSPLFTRWIRPLVALGFDINERDFEGRTPLMIAVENDDAEMVAALTRAGADREAVGDLGRTAIAQAAVGGKDRALGALIDALADIEREDEVGMRPLHLSMLSGSAACARALIAAGAQIEARDENGRTPARLAAAFAGSACFAVMAEAGADLRAADRRGQTPLDVAQRLSGPGSSDRERAAREICHQIARAGCAREATLIEQALPTAPEDSTGPDAADSPDEWASIGVGCRRPGQRSSRL